MVYVIIDEFLINFGSKFELLPLSVPNLLFIIVNKKEINHFWFTYTENLRVNYFLGL